MGDLNLRRTIEAAAQRALQRATPTDDQLAERLAQIRRVRDRLTAEEQARAESKRLSVALLKAADAPSIYVDERGTPAGFSGEDRDLMAALESEQRAVARKLAGAIEPKEQMSD